MSYWLAASVPVFGCLANQNPRENRRVAAIFTAGPPLSGPGRASRDGSPLQRLTSGPLATAAGRSS